MTLKYFLENTPQQVILAFDDGQNIGEIAHLQNEIRELVKERMKTEQEFCENKDKLTQRNKQVADLKHRLEEAEDTLKELKEIINAFDLDGVNDQEHLEALKIIVNK